MATAPEDDRLALLEQVVARQQEEFRERIAQHEAEIARLKAALADDATEQAAPAPSGRARTKSATRTKTSRRTLLQLGGAAAAAGVAALATGLAGTTPTPPTTRTPWTTRSF